jgi:hypothetical protein
VSVRRRFAPCLVACAVVASSVSSTTRALCDGVAPPAVASPAAAPTSGGATSSPPPAPAAAAAPAPAAHKAGAPYVAPEPRRTIRTFAWASFAVGGVAALVAIGTSGLILYQKGVRDDNCDSHKLCSSRGLAANETVHSMIPWNTASWIVAVVGVGAGVGLWLSSRDSSQTAITVSPAVAGATVGFRSTF